MSNSKQHSRHLSVHPSGVIYDQSEAMLTQSNVHSHNGAVNNAHLQRHSDPQMYSRHNRSAPLPQSKPKRDWKAAYEEMKVKCQKAYSEYKKKLTELSTLKSTLSELRSLYEKAGAELQQNDEKCDRIAKDYKSKISELESKHKSQMNELNNKISNLEQKCNGKTQKISQLEKNIQSIETKLSTDTEKFNSFHKQCQSKIVEYNTTLKCKETQLSQLQKKHRTTVERLNTLLRDISWSDTAALPIDIDNSRGDTTVKFAEMSRRMETLSERLDKLSAQNCEYIQKINRLSSQNTQLSERLKRESLPIGSVIMWNDTNSELLHSPNVNKVIPNGWIECNGQNNTPDLTHFFSNKNKNISFDTSQEFENGFSFMKHSTDKWHPSNDIRLESNHNPKIVFITKISDSSFS